MATIMEVAAMAGVSMKTVSRVMNGELHVRPVMREKVLAAAHALNYRPNLAARQLAAKRSFLIGYPFVHPADSYVTEVLLGAAATCRDRNYHIVAEPIEDEAAAVEGIRRLITTLRPDGLILIPPLSDTLEIIEMVARHDVPLVRISGYLPGPGDIVAVDDRSISTQMCAHLIGQGHRRIGFIRPHPDHGHAASRYQGYLDALAAAEIEPDERLIRQGFFDIESGAAATAALLDLPEPPSAIFAANDEMALGALRMALSRNLAVPGDIAIAGFDDSPASRAAWPPLTTVRQPTRAIGSQAAKLLLDKKHVLADLRHEMVIRGSTVTTGA